IHRRFGHRLAGAQHQREARRTCRDRQMIGALHFRRDPAYEEAAEHDEVIANVFRQFAGSQHRTSTASAHPLRTRGSLEFYEAPGGNVSEEDRGHHQAVQARR
ncbi:hypothetical protein KXW36_000745, partial [Aspergillus fumigatus]